MGAYRILNPKEKVSTIFALKSPGLGKRGGEVGSRKPEVISPKEATLVIGASFGLIYIFTKVVLPTTVLSLLFTTCII